MNAAMQSNLSTAYKLAHVGGDKLQKLYDHQGRVCVDKVTMEAVSDALDDLNKASCALRAVKNQLLGNPETRSRT